MENQFADNIPAQHQVQRTEEPVGDSNRGHKTELTQPSMNVDFELDEDWDFGITPSRSPMHRNPYVVRLKGPAPEPVKVVLGRLKRGKLSWDGFITALLALEDFDDVKVDGFAGQLLTPHRGSFLAQARASGKGARAKKDWDIYILPPTLDTAAPCRVLLQGTAVPSQVTDAVASFASGKLRWDDFIGALLACEGFDDVRVAEFRKQLRARDSRSLLEQAKASGKGLACDSEGQRGGKKLANIAAAGRAKLMRHAAAGHLAEKDWGIRLLPPQRSKEAPYRAYCCGGQWCRVR